MRRTDRHRRKWGSIRHRTIHGDGRSRSERMAVKTRSHALPDPETLPLHQMPLSSVVPYVVTEKVRDLSVNHSANWDFPMALKYFKLMAIGPTP